MPICACLLLLSSIVRSFPQETKDTIVTTEEQYYDSLLKANEAIFQREFESPFLALLDQETEKSYLSIDSLAKRKLFIKSFWNRHKPNPIASKNDLLEIFIARWNDVKQNFSSPVPPYFDDRGKYYLKYGKPSNRYQDSGGRKTVRFFKDRELYQYISRLYSGFPPAIEYWIYVNESWVYRALGQDFVIHFVKAGENFQEVTSLTRAIETGIAKNVAWYWSDMIQYRAHLSPSFARAANNALDVENDLLTSAFSRSSTIPQHDARLPHNRIFEHKTSLEVDIIKTKSNAPTFFCFLPEDKDRLRFFSDIAQFRGQGDSTRLEILFLAPFQNNILRHDSLTSIEIECQSQIRDLTYNPILHGRDTFSYSIEMAKSNQNAIGILKFSAPPNEGDLTLQMRDIETEKAGYSKQAFEVRNFTSSELMMSDIQFFFDASQISGIKPSLVREINDVPVIPYPYEYIRKSLPAFCYFEIYNIKTAGIHNEFEIQLKVIAEKSRDNILKRAVQWLVGSTYITISMTQSHSVTQDDETELIAIDFSKLKPGNYLLEASIADARDKRFIAMAQKRIKISD